jgi:hypothetical protein
MTEKLVTAYDAASAIDFCQLLPEIQTVIASVAFQYGDLAVETPNFWAQVTEQRWQDAIENLEDFEDDYEARRDREAYRMFSGLDPLNDTDGMPPEAPLVPLSPANDLVQQSNANQDCGCGGHG